MDVDMTADQAMAHDDIGQPRIHGQEVHHHELRQQANFVTPAGTREVLHSKPLPPGDLSALLHCEAMPVIATGLVHPFP
jgi:hypothetical protein